MQASADSFAFNSTFTPLIFSGILYACNGRYHIAYIDCLFLCVTSMTVCGLATVNLSTLTPFQQFLLFAQMCLGSPVGVPTAELITSNILTPCRWLSLGSWYIFGGTETPLCVCVPL